MNILGLTLGQVSTAAILIDDKVMACVSEERFSRSKGDESYPKKSIDYVLESAGIKGCELDKVVIAGLSLNLTANLVRTYSNWDIKDHVRQMKEYWYPVLYENKQINYLELFKEKIDLEQYPGTWEKLIQGTEGYFLADDWPKYQTFLYELLASHLGITTDKIICLDHHTCHAAYAYWASPIRGDDTLIMTADAWGDGLSLTLSTIDSDGSIQQLHKVSDKEFTLARLYRYITLLMGMKPNEHEFKVMGLAPYTKDVVLEGPYRVFKEHMYVDGIDFKYHNKPEDYYFWFKERLEGFRFDGIAGGLQRYVEEIMIEFTRNALKKFNKKRLLFSGGIAMNIKANMLLKDLEEVEDFFVMGSGGDDSLAIGACYAYMDKEEKNRNLNSLENLNLGPDIDQEQVKDILQKAAIDEYFVQDINDRDVAGLLARGWVIGRCCGRMEFGARALGNRTIMADPRHREIVAVINNKIKNRDFWMPFAPSILEEDADKYLLNPKGINSPHMSIGFESTPEGKKVLEAATHPADFTLRPQIVSKASNPDYYSLLKAFKMLTGVGGILNTSFNLHGEPIVNTPEDAYRVFKLTDIDALLFEGVLISKKDTHTSAFS
jgi:carbamoyltransferase